LFFEFLLFFTFFAFLFLALLIEASENATLSGTYAEGGTGAGYEGSVRNHHFALFQTN